MKIVSIGGGPAGLYFAILLKKADPAHRISVLERNRPDDTFGFGVVFSDATLDNLQEADPESYARIVDAFYHWDDIDIHYKGEVLTSTGHGFAGFARSALLSILEDRCRELHVDIRHEVEVAGLEQFGDADLILGADGASSLVRDSLAEHFKPHIDWRPNKFVWLGTTRPFDAFTFYFKETEHGLWRVHAYQYWPTESTFIVEATDETFHASGLDPDDEDATVAFCEALFEEELRGHRLEKNKSIWRSFPTITNACWHHDNVVLLGDAAHTAHFSVGSGTKLAMEDSIALAAALQEHAGSLPAAATIGAALEAYEKERRPAVESLQRAAQVSLQWFEDTERYMDFEPTQFAFNLLTRSLRITHENLRERDPEFVAGVNEWFAAKTIEQAGDEAVAQAVAISGIDARAKPAPPPMFTPFRLRDMVLANRVVVSPMCQYLADDGTPGDWHYVHIGVRAVGGAGLVITEMTDVSRDGRISPGCTGLYKPEHVGAWKRIVDFVHHNSYAKIGMQLGHAGRKGSTKLAWEGMDQPLDEGNWELLGPSPIPFLDNSQIPRPMDRADMDAVRDDYVRAAEMAEEAGFDILEVHFAHGYLLATFISPLINRRDDEYGGPLENRMRFPLEVFDAVRAVWPAHKPMSVRISAVDWAPGGTQPEDAVEMAKLLKQHECDIVDVSAGQTVADAKPLYGRQFQTPFADRIRHEAGIATMAVGNISSFMDVNTILAAGRADLCALARAHLWDPYWTRNAAYKAGYELPWPDPYSVLDNYTPRFE